MNVERMTLRVQQALNDANLTAVKYNHQRNGGQRKWQDMAN